MGWWSADILGGDEPLDALGALEAAIGWNSDKLGFVHDAESKGEFQKRMKLPQNQKRVVALVQKWAASKSNNAVSILAVVHVMLIHGVSIDSDIARWALEATRKDEWGQTGESDRVEALDDFVRRLEAAAGGSPAKLVAFKVMVREEVEFVREFTIKAVSLKEARERALEICKNTAVTKRGWAIADNRDTVTSLVEIPGNPYDH